MYVRVGKCKKMSLILNTHTYILARYATVATEDLTVGRVFVLDYRFAALLRAISSAYVRFIMSGTLHSNNIQDIYTFLVSVSFYFY